MIPQYLDNDCFKVIVGDQTVMEHLLDLPFAHVCFADCSPYDCSAKIEQGNRLTSGIFASYGKSLTIVSRKAQIEQAAKGLAWAEIVNASWMHTQWCQPNYILVQKKILPHFLTALRKV